MKNKITPLLAVCAWCLVLLPAIAETQYEFQTNNGTITIKGLSYAEEDRRGQQAWEKYKAVLKAQGEKLDAKDFIPPPIPDDQNILKAPIMEGWMYQTAPQTNHARPLIQIPETGVVYGDWANGEFTDLLEWKVYVQKKNREAVAATNTSPAAVSIRALTNATTSASIINLFPNASKEIMPLILIEQAPLADAIGNLARQVGIKIQIAPGVIDSPSPNISFRWENITSLLALQAVLKNHSLTLVPDPKTGVALVTRKSPSASADKALLLKSEKSSAADTNSVMPLIVINDAPLADAIRNLARMSGINFQFAPDVFDASKPMPTVSFRWENVTAPQALEALLDNYSLMLVPDVETGVARVTVKPPAEFDYEAYMERLARSIPPADTNGVSPLITLTNAPLTDAIRALARNAGLNIQIDSKAVANAAPVTFRWEKITPMQALQKLLSEHRLILEIARPANPEIWRVISRPAQATVILEDFKKYESEFKDLHEALQRPKARYDIDYEGWLHGRVQINFLSARTLAQSLSLHGSAALALNENARALQDVLDSIHLSEVAKSQSDLVGAMIRVAVVGLTTQPIWEGLASHRWTPNQLAELQKQLSSVDLLSDMAFGLRGHRAHSCYALEKFSREELSRFYVYSGNNGSLSPEEENRRRSILFAPRGWLYQSELVSARAMQETLDSIDLKAQLLSMTKLQAASNNVAQAIAPFSYFTVDFSRAVLTAVRDQTGVNQAIIACALERHRLAHGEYPEKLEALVPEFIAQLPHEIFNGQPLKYHRDNQDHFTFYSIGSDEKDDGGTPITGYDYSKPGDWVWPSVPKK